MTPNIWVGLDATLSAQIRFSRCVFSRNGNGVRVRVCTFLLLVSSFYDSDGSTSVKKEQNQGETN